MNKTLFLNWIMALALISLPFGLEAKTKSKSGKTKAHSSQTAKKKSKNVAKKTGKKSSGHKIAAEYMKAGKKSQKRDIASTKKLKHHKKSKSGKRKHRRS